MGCASDPAPPPPPAPLPPTEINLQIDSDTIINPDAGGKASPVLLRIYELKEQSNFMNADFFALFDKEQATLAADLIHKQEIVMQAGEKKTLQIEADANTKFIGVFAAFRQLENAQWRAVKPLELHKLNNFLLKIQGTIVNLSEVPAKADK